MPEVVAGSMWGKPNGCVASREADLELTSGDGDEKLVSL